jgi:hypothetical protein
MFIESAISITLVRPDATTTLELSSGRALVGSGAHCDVRLAPDEAAMEHLLIEARDEQIFVEVRNLEPACRLNGAPFLGGFLPVEAPLELGALVLKVKLEERQEGAASKPSTGNKSQTHPAVQALGLVAVAVGLFYAIEAPEVSESVFDAAMTPPALFADLGKATCPQADPEAAASLAHQERVAAENKAERSPFYPGDGLAAVALYERARVCHLAAGEKQAADESAAASARLRTQLSDELHVRHVRLERFLAQSKFDDVAREARLLSELVPDFGSPYAQWLSAVRREVAVRKNQGKGS